MYIGNAFNSGVKYQLHPRNTKGAIDHVQIVHTLVNKLLGLFDKNKKTFTNNTVIGTHPQGEPFKKSCIRNTNNYLVYERTLLQTNLFIYFKPYFVS